MLNIWTWNVNSVRGKVDNVRELLALENIDILFLTETKIQKKHEGELNFGKDYSVIFNSNKNSYHHGVAFVYRKDKVKMEVISLELPVSHLIMNCKTEINNKKNAHIFEKTSAKDIQETCKKAHKTEGRILTVKCEFSGKTIILVGTYVPNSGVNRNDPLLRLPYRTLSWDKDLYTHLLNLEKEYGKVIWLGDLNVAKNDNDLSNVKNNYAGTTLEERNNMSKFMENSKWIDTWHVLNPNITHFKDRCTYGVTTHCKLRLDYVICSSDLEKNLYSSFARQSFPSSDHCPMGTKFNF
jgi:exodeoxyribonuclease III